MIHLELITQTDMDEVVVTEVWKSPSRFSIKLKLFELF
jgi:hypothetical protein